LAVEDVHNDFYQCVGEFNFFLHRLTPAQKQGISTRTVNIGMTMQVDGKFIVSIYDPLDPEHIQKKKRYQAAKQREEGHDDSSKPTLNHFDYDDDVQEVTTVQQICLIIACFVVFILYVAVRMSFHEHESSEHDGSEL